MGKTPNKKEGSKMGRTLWETFRDAYDHNTNGVQWCVFRSRKKICGDYGALTGDQEIDTAEVIKAEVKHSKNGRRYVRVTIK